MGNTPGCVGALRSTSLDCGNTSSMSCSEAAGMGKILCTCVGDGSAAVDFAFWVPFCLCCGLPNGVPFFLLLRLEGDAVGFGVPDDTSPVFVSATNVESTVVGLRPRCCKGGTSSFDLRSSSL